MPPAPGDVADSDPVIEVPAPTSDPVAPASEPGSPATEAPPATRPMFSVLACLLVALTFGWLIFTYVWNAPLRVTLRALTSPEAGTRDEAVRSLVGIANTPSELTSVLDSLIASLEDESPMVRVSALNALVANLQDIRKKGEASPLGAAVEARLKDIKECLLGALKDPDDSVRGLALGCVGIVVGGSGEPLPRDVWVCLEDKTEFVRSNAVDTLRLYKKGLDAAIPPLLRMFEGQAGTTRAAFEQAINSLRPTASSLPMLRKALASPSSEQRWLAARLIGQMGAEGGPAVPELIALMHQEFRTKLPTGLNTIEKPYNDPGIAAARALGSVASGLKKEEAAPALKALLGALDCGERPRISAVAAAIGQFGNNASEAIPALRAELSNPRWAKSFDRAVPQALASVSKGTKSQAEIITLLGEAWRTADSRRDAGLASALKSLGPDAIKAYPALKLWKKPEDDYVDTD